MYSATDLPRRHSGAAAPLRRKIGTIIESAFDVTDDVCRSARDDVYRSANFRPLHAEVHIDLDTGSYYVALSGPFYSGTRPFIGSGRHVFTGEHFLDADEHRNDLVVDAVNECLRVHGKVKLP